MSKHSTSNSTSNIFYSKAVNIITMLISSQGLSSPSFGSIENSPSGISSKPDSFHLIGILQSFVNLSSY